MAASYSRRKELRSCRLMLKVSLKLSSVPFQRPCARSSEGLSMAEKTAAPHSRYRMMRRASSAKRPLSSLRCRERQLCSRWLGIIQISAPLARRTATSSASEAAAAPLAAGRLGVTVRPPSLHSCGRHLHLHAAAVGSPRCPAVVAKWHDVCLRLSVCA